MNQNGEINVHIGEVKIGHAGEVLKTILGSCLGIAIVWRSKGVCGLAHCLLPAATKPTEALGGKYVDQALISLVKLMEITSFDLPEIEAIVVGGGNMTNPQIRKPEDLVGVANYQMAKKLLDKMKIRIAHVDVGDDMGRTLRLDCTTGNFEIQKIPRLKVA